MSSASGFSRRWQKVRRLPGRIPLRIKLISAVLALVAIALSIISIVGISVLRGYLLNQTDAQLENPDGWHGYVQHYLFHPSLTVSFGGLLWVAYLPSGSPAQLIVAPVTGQPGSSQQVPPPAIPTSAAWLAAHDG